VSNYEINNEGFADRLKLLIGDEKPFPWASNIGLTPGVFNRMWNEGIPPKAQHLLLISKKTGVSLDWLLSGVGPMYIKDKGEETTKDRGFVYIPKHAAPDPEEFDYVPMAEVQLSAGNGAFVLSEDMQEHYAFRKDWLSRTVSSARNAVLVHVTGNSMAPTIIENDVVMLDTARRHVYDGKIYALRMDNTVMVKRLALRPADRILVISDNKEEYEPYEADRKDIHVLGQIVWFARTLVKTD